MKFESCLEELSKIAGLGDAVKRLAMTEIPGTKPWLIRPAAEKASLAKGMGRAASGTRPAVTKRMSSGAWDVSDMAAKMGLDK